jgi:CDP-glucose 4,6-dehydratase
MGFRRSTLEGMGVTSNRRQVDPHFWVDKSVLITGHTGFKGSWLSLWLAKLGAKVSGISLKPQTCPSLFAELRLEGLLRNHWIVDIRDLNSVSQLVEASKPQVIFHLAAQPLVRQSYRDPLETWSTNVMGSLHILETLRKIHHQCAVVMVTTDKVYENQEWDHGYRESDRLGGNDPYSASKAAAELAIQSWRQSFCGPASHQYPNLGIATARAGNVIGGGDWSIDRIIPDLVRSLVKNQALQVRNPHSLRPWQHVLEPLSGYIVLAQELFNNPESMCEAFNFGPSIKNNVSVAELVDESYKHWPGTWKSDFSAFAPHEASLLHLQTDKAWHRLGWCAKWDLQETVEKTILWYYKHHNGTPALKCCEDDLDSFTS